MALEIPRVQYANVGGSGSWGYRFPEGAFGDDAPLAVRRLEGGLVFETPYGASPPFGLYELTDRRTGQTKRFLRVWMHGQDRREKPTLADPYAGTPMRSAEKTFWVLGQAGVTWILIDASVGGINPLLDTWDLVIAHDFFDDMKRVPWLESQRMFSLRRPYSPYLRRLLFEACGRHLARYTELAQRIAGEPVLPKIVKRGVYVCPDGPWFESPAQIRDYQQRGFDVVGKTVVPEVQLARAIGAQFACVNPVVNPAEGLVDPDSGAMYDWSSEDLFKIYDTYGPVISAMVLDAMASIDPACEEARRATAEAPFNPRNYAQFME
jgi:5'-methylthioadenosine phosphorylase